MTSWLTLGGVALATLTSLLFSTLTYALRDFSRARLTDHLAKLDKSQWLEKTITDRDDLIFVTAVVRLVSNILILVGVLHFVGAYHVSEWLRYLIAVIAAGIITLFSSVAIPHALAAHAGERLIATQVQFLHFLRFAMHPATRIMHLINHTVAKAAGALGSPSIEQAEQEIQEEILSVVQEGEKEGIVDEREREMIESVIQFRNTTVAQVMTSRPEIISLKAGASLQEVKDIVESSGHSRIPVHNGSLDQITGILYSRDLLKFLGEPPERFDLRAATRPTFDVPESRLLPDLLQDFRQKKVHLAIVLDEYGGTAGLVSIEDVLEELVGDISDEHEPQAPAMMKRIDDHTFEADARIRLEEFNSGLDVSLPEDAGYETLGGFVSNTLGRIPAVGTKFDHAGLRFTILESEPQRVNRVRIEIIPQSSEPLAEEQAARL